MPIERNRNICFGQPTLKGTRLTVFNIVSYLYHTESLSDYLKDFDLKLSDINDTIEYCKKTECGNLKNPYDKYCEGCILSTISEGNSFHREEFTEYGNKDKITISQDDKLLFLGSIDQLEKSEFGVPGWMLAEEVEKKFPNIT